jgi:hypothetical protein
LNLSKEAWFALFVAFCAGWAANTMRRVLRGEDVVIAGKEIDRVQVVSILALSLFVIGIIAAINLGLIQDHAP